MSAMQGSSSPPTGGLAGEGADAAAATAVDAALLSASATVPTAGGGVWDDAQPAVPPMVPLAARWSRVGWAMEAAAAAAAAAEIVDAALLAPACVVSVAARSARADSAVAAAVTGPRRSEEL